MPPPHRTLAFGFVVGVLGTLVLTAAGADPCRSGLQPGQRPGPYTAVMSTGPLRGKSHCYICETAEKPAVVIFARSLSEPLAKLTGQFDKALADYQAAGLRAWVTFLSDDQPALDTKVVKWSADHALRRVPLGVFEDAGGPPSYRLARDADVTVLLLVGHKVTANFAFRSGELTDAAIAGVIKALPSLFSKK
jgi:hypothetical protein